MQVTSGVFWRRHIDHLRPIGDSMSIQNQSNSTPPSLPVPSDFIPIADSENNEEIPAHDPVVEQSSTIERHYPKRHIKDHLPVMLNDCYFVFCKLF